MHVKDYRESHKAKDRGLLYNSRFLENRAYFHWETYEKPFLHKLFKSLAATKSGPMLDFACGTGRITKVASQYFHDLTGIDVSQEMLKEAVKDVSGAKFVKMDVTTQKSGFGEFDVITAFRFFLNAQPALRHEALAWISRHLSKDGVFILNNHLSCESINGRLICWARAAGITERNCLSEKSLVKLLAENGFHSELIYSYAIIPGFHAFPPVNMPLFKRIESMLWRYPFAKALAEQKIYLCRRKN